jgi:hypothetical protein
MPGGSVSPDPRASRVRFTGSTVADYNGWFAGKLPLITILDVEQIAIIICDREQTAARRR